MPHLDANDLGDLDLDGDVSPADEPPSGLLDALLATAAGDGAA
jgi:hypothetical protein